GEARVVPRRIDEGVHRVGLAPRGPAALRAFAIDEVGALVERVAGPVGHAVFGEHDRQLIVRHRDVAAHVAVNNGNGAAPVALARDAPVAQPPLYLLVAEPEAV